MNYWVDGGASGNCGSGGNCGSFVGPNGETDGSSTPYSSVSGYELSNTHYDLAYYSSSYACNAAAACGFADFASANGLSQYCPTYGYLIYYVPEYCKAGYELTSFSESGTTCWPASQGTPVTECEPCALGW